jgi:hypothetical protein
VRLRFYATIAYRAPPAVRAAQSFRATRGRQGASEQQLAGDWQKASKLVFRDLTP